MIIQQTELPTTPNDSKWDDMIEQVSYPVYIKELHFYHDDLVTNRHDVEHRAEGITNTGRLCEFYGIVVDRWNDGKLSTIATVTGLYDTIPAASVYDSIRNDLTNLGIDNEPSSLYISGNGGKHQLSIKLNGLNWLSPNGDITMHMIVTTSVDGSTKHTLRVAAVDETGCEVCGVGGAVFNMSTRHTKSIHQRHAGFSVIINGLVEHWNDTIIPTMMIMCDSEFDKSVAIDILTALMDDVNLPEKHQDNMLYTYTQTQATNSMFDICHQLSKYLDGELSAKPERLDEFKSRISKHSEKLIKRYIKTV